jgi:hypothetical protein
MSTLDSARRDWEDGYRRFLDLVARSDHAESAHQELGLVSDELRKRVGATFTLEELAMAYRGAEDWARALLVERATSSRWPLTLASTVDAAFHLYSRGAADYRP